MDNPNLSNSSLMQLLDEQLLVLIMLRNKEEISLFQPGRGTAEPALSNWI